jgi:serine/threonine-protein kinase
VVENPQRILAGRYEVGELIGRGGMAEVHIGHDARLGRTVAIKILRADLARDPSFLARFRREAQAAAALNHPAIVSVYDTGEDQHTEADGQVSHTPFIVMEYVEGHTVRDILRDGHAVPIDEAVEITSGVLSALEYSHHAGIVHRDIKPANVMITPTGAVKVMDFGIARAIADSAATMTQTQAVVGTAQYLSPEQARGETVDARSDLYSTGCLLFELLTGRTPFTGDSPVAVVYQHVSETPPKPSDIAPDVPEVLDRVTLRALAKDRNQRYGSAAEFRGDLEAAMRGGQIVAPGVGVGLAAAGAATGATMALEGATQVMAPTPTGWPTTATQTPPPAAFPAADVDEPGEPPRKSHKGLIWTLVTIGVLALAAIITMLLLHDGGSDAPPSVTVPNVVGLSKADAQKKLTADGLDMAPLVDTDSDEPADTATKSDPKAGTAAHKDDTVQVWFSAGPKAVKVPDVKGMSQSDARDALQAAGLTAGNVQVVNDSSVDKDHVVKTDPAIGDPADKSTPVTLYVASGLVDLPDLTKSDPDDAEATLDKLGLSFGEKNKETDDASLVGKVVQQNPAPGAVAQGTTVILYIGVPVDNSTTVPSNLVGMTVDQAGDALGQANLTQGPVQQQPSPTAPVGQVIASNPAPGSAAKVGDPVTLVVSSGPTASPTDGSTPGATPGATQTQGAAQPGADQGQGAQGRDRGDGQALGLLWGKRGR